MLFSSSTSVWLRAVLGAAVSVVLGRCCLHSFILMGRALVNYMGTADPVLLELSSGKSNVGSP